MNKRTDINKEKRKEIKEEKKKIKKVKRKKFWRAFLFFLLLIITILLLYAFLVEPYNLIVHEYNVKDNSLPDSFYGVKVVHFSDLHYGTTINSENIKKVLNKINDLEPDIVVFTGDLIDKNYKMSTNDKTILNNFLSSISFELGKYSVIGNHDNDETYKLLMKNSGFIFLDNSYDTIYNKDLNQIIIYGLSLNMENINLDETINNTPYKIVIMHNPDDITQINNYAQFNLALAGHSHNGQINIYKLKNYFLPNGATKYYEPYYRLGNTSFYISNGIGTSIINARFLSTPSINLYRLVK